MAGGKRGPRKQTAAEKTVRNNSRRRGRNKPTAPAVKKPRAGACPKWMPAAAKAEWKRVVPFLEKARLLSEADQAALVSYCLAVANLQSATKTLAGGPSTFETEKGYVGKHPAATLQREAMQTVLKFAQEFGLTPASRERLDLPSAADSAAAAGVGDYAKSKGA